MGIKIRLKKSMEVPISNALNNNRGYGNAAAAAALSTTATSAIATTTTTTTKQKKSVTAAAAAAVASTAVPIGSTAATSSSGTPGTSKPTRKRQRKSRHKDTSDSDDSDYEKRRKNSNSAVEKYRNRKQHTTSTEYTEPDEQSQWGNVIPEHILLKIFEEAINQYGSLPTIVNVGRVCSLWRRISLTPHLWHTMDLSSWTKDRSEINLKRIIATHLQWCKDVNLGKQIFTSNQVFQIFLIFKLATSLAPPW